MEWDQVGQVRQGFAPALIYLYKARIFLLVDLQTLPL